MIGGRVSETDFFRRRKKDECFFARDGGGGGCVSFCVEVVAVCGALGCDLSCDTMWVELLGVVLGRG
jgi:hypothetical protein